MRGLNGVLTKIILQNKMDNILTIGIYVSPFFILYIMFIGYKAIKESLYKYEEKNKLNK